MAYDVTDSIERLQGYLQGAGHASFSQIGEPKQPPDGEQITASVFFQSVATRSLTANGSSREVHTLIVRLYLDMLMEPTADVELGLARAYSFIIEDLAADKTLNTTIMAVDFGGIAGQPVRADWGYLELHGTTFRICDILVPLLVDGSYTVA